MLLLLPQGTAGTTAVGVSDTASLSIDEANINDFYIETLDTASVSLSDVATPAVRLDRSDFLLISLADVSAVAVSGTTAKAGTDTASISIDDAAVPAVVAATFDVTDTTSLTLSEASTLDVGQIAVDVTDDTAIAAEDFAFSSSVADVSRAGGDAISIHLEDSASVYDMPPVAAIRFYPAPDQIRFSVQ